MKFSRVRFAAILSALCLALGSGCTTATRTHAPAPAAPAVTPARPTEVAPAPPRSAAPSEATAPAPAAPATAPAAGVAPSGEAAAGTLDLVVDSAPPGAIIVLDGVPVGKAPLHLQIAATPLGYFRDYVEIRARFVATDEEEVTRSSVEEYTPREKIPAMVRFTPDGAQRTMR